MNSNHYVLILAGGAGTRLWPKSKCGLPKQFLDILNVGKTLIQITYERYISFIPKENIYIITHKDFEQIVQEQVPGLAPENILIEPSGKNTASSVLYGAMKLYGRNPSANLIISPADQLILEQKTFEEEITRGLDFTDQIKALVTVGVKPTYPNTNYGYIQHAHVDAVPGIYKVKTFTEKPNLEIAQAFLDSGDFLWNSGIFIWRAKNILDNFEKHLPEVYEVFDAEKDKLNTPEERNAINRIYPFCIVMSIDNFILEKLQNVYVIPSTFGWTDIGTWSSVYETLEKDYLGNAVVGDKTIIIDATQCMISTDNNKLVVLQGVDDLIIIDTKDSLLICKKNKENELKDYVAEVKRNYDDEFL
ncbi:mannose-1-phosphate guanylyltransferase [Haoranjiania flava]|uniref:mannose-1-phosphate guanylyltransferase n=1 Tax=Haoranjiania flava TaxID=1856322 RepID=A0AAE3IKH0_9BACT|nr:sugar phosphate nucleotidyltransferase [Haoranjiania flava]MCU7693459.1 sugar phosphate nucleotidyltransferase [Haoranjiania flava]